MKNGFVSNGGGRLRIALRSRVRAEVEERCREALAGARKPGELLDLRLQMEFDIEQEVRRRMPGRQALFFS